MRALVVSFSLVFTLLASATAQELDTLTVMGTGKVWVPADRATLIVPLEVSAAKPTEAATKLASLMERIHEELAKVEVPQDAVRVARCQLQKAQGGGAVQMRAGGAQQVALGETQLSMELEVDVPWDAGEDTPAMLGRIALVMESLETAGVVIVQNRQRAYYNGMPTLPALRLSFEEDAELMRRLTDAAVADARARAAQLARATGTKVGRVRAIADVAQATTTNWLYERGNTLLRGFEQGTSVRVTFELRSADEEAENDEPTADEPTADEPTAEEPTAEEPAEEAEPAQEQE